MPQARADRTKCEFRDGRKKCTRWGVGTPSLCDSHRATLEQFGWHVPRPGIGEQLGGLFDQMLHGQRPNSVQVEQVAADVVGALMGRKVTIEEVRQVRQGDIAMLRAYAEQFARARAQNRPTGHAGAIPHGPSQPPFDPSIAAKIEHAKACGRARAVLGFGAKDALTEPILKARLRELARKHHPDVPGGSTEKMQRINGAIDLLLKSL